MVCSALRAAARAGRRSRGGRNPGLARCAGLPGIRILPGARRRRAQRRAGRVRTAISSGRDSRRGDARCLCRWPRPDPAPAKTSTSFIATKTSGRFEGEADWPRFKPDAAVWDVSRPRLHGPSNLAAAVGGYRAPLAPPWGARLRPRDYAPSRGAAHRSRARRALSPRCVSVTARMPTQPRKRRARGELSRRRSFRRPSRTLARAHQRVGATAHRDCDPDLWLRRWLRTSSSACGGFASAPITATTSSKEPGRRDARLSRHRATSSCHLGTQGPRVRNSPRRDDRRPPDVGAYALNDDVEPMNAGWLWDAMLDTHHRRRSAPSAQVRFHPDGCPHRRWRGGRRRRGRAPSSPVPPAPGCGGIAVRVRNCSAVTGACLLTRREVMMKRSAASTRRSRSTSTTWISACASDARAAFRIVFTPHARPFHHELGQLRRAARRPGEVAGDGGRGGGSVLEHDTSPYYNG